MQCEVEVPIAVQVGDRDLYRKSGDDPRVIVKVASW